MKASFLVGLAAILAAAHAGLAATETVVTSPDSAVQFRLNWGEGRLDFTVNSGTRTIIERSPMRFTVNGVDLTAGVEAGPSVVSLKCVDITARPVPEGHLTIAQRFNVGWTADTRQVPKGRMKLCIGN